MALLGRRAVATDARCLSALALRSKAVWGYSDAFLARCRQELTLTPEQVEEDWGYLYEERDADGVTSVVGFVLVSRCPADYLTEFHAEPAGAGSTFEIEALFVEPEQLGCGHGRRLFDAALGMCESHCPLGRLLVQSDPHAEAFYVRCGAKRLGWLESASIPGRELPLLGIDW